VRQRKEGGLSMSHAARQICCRHAAAQRLPCQRCYEAAQYGARSCAVWRVTAVHAAPARRCCCRVTHGVTARCGAACMPPLAAVAVAAAPASCCYASVTLLQRYAVALLRVVAAYARYVVCCRNGALFTARRYACSLLQS